METKVKSKKNNAVIVAIGSILLVGVLFLTGFAVKLFVEKINSNADAVYAQTKTGYIEYLRDRFLRRQSNESSSEDDNRSVSVSGYSSDDLVQVDGEWYILSDLVLDENNEGDKVPVLVDTANVILVDGQQYMHIENPQAVASSQDDRNLFGNEYIVVDIDGNIVYLVHKGDTLSQVSGRIGYSVQELAKFNDIANVNMIYEGQTLRVPASDEIVDYIKSHSDTVGSATDSSASDVSESEDTSEEVKASDLTDDATSDADESSGQSETTEEESVTP